MQFERQTDAFHAFDGTRLFVRAWITPGFDPGRVILLHHGIGEHSDRYGHLVEALEGTGFSILAFDARGHGRSGGTPGAARGISQLVEDLEAFILFVRERYGIEKPILLGHSLGGLVAAAFALRYSNQWEIKALVLSAPGLKIPIGPVQRLKKVSAQMLFRLTPDLIMPSGLAVEHISHDPGEVEAYRNDPMVHDRLSIRLGLGILDGGPAVLAAAARLQIPLWMGHGQGDLITDPAGTVEFFRKARSPDKTLRLYPGLYHEIFNETPADRGRVLGDLTAWLLERFPASSAPQPEVIERSAENTVSAPAVV